MGLIIKAPRPKPAAVPLTIDLPPETLAALRQFAEDYGVTAEQLAASVMALHFPPPPPAREFTPEELERWGRYVEALRAAHPPEPPPPPVPMTPRRREASARLREVRDEMGAARHADDPPDDDIGDDPAGPAAWDANEKRLERRDGGLHAAEAAADRIVGPARR